MRAGLAALALLAALPAGAGEVAFRDCDTYEASARNVQLPWADAHRSFANDRIRLIELDTGEPACCSVHLMVIHPLPDEPYPACRLISVSPDGRGFSQISLPDSLATYDPVNGLRVRIDATAFDGLRDVPYEFTLIIDQATGTVSLP